MKNNITFLNKYIEAKDFEFFANSESEIVILDKQITSQKLKKSALLSYIDLLNSTTSQNSNELKSKAEATLLIVDKNINSIYKLIENIKLINVEMNDLLVLIKQNTMEDYCIKKAETLKPIINNFSDNYNEERTIIFNNNGVIDSFIFSFECRDFFNNYFNNSYITESALSPDNPQTLNNNYEIKVSSDNIESPDDIKDNNVLIVSEKDMKVYLPYKASEIKAYMSQYPGQYLSTDTVIRKEFVLPLDYYLKFPALSRFREAYALIRDREAKSVAESLKFAFNLMFRRDLNPVIVSACKSQEDLEKYIKCLDDNDLSSFDSFEINFEINPFAVPN